MAEEDSDQDVSEGESNNTTYHKSPDDLGGYTYQEIEPYIGNYLFLRPTFRGRPRPRADGRGAVSELDRNLGALALIKHGLERLAALAVEPIAA